MTKVRSLLVGFVMLGASVATGWAAYAPVQVVIVPFQTPTMFSLVLVDPTWEIVVLQGPLQGIIVGIPPHLTYIPNPGFWGTDWIAYAVTTPTGQFDLGMVQLLVLAPGITMSPPVLMWEGYIKLSGPTFAIDGMSTTLAIHQRFAYFEQTIRASFTQAGFIGLTATTKMELEGTVPAVWRLPITSTLDFDPAIPGLRSWTVDARTSLLGATWIYYFYFSGTDPQTSSYSLFTVQGAVGGISFASRVRFATLTPTLDEYRLLLRGSLTVLGCCDLPWDLEFIHRKAGFGHLIVGVRDIPIPCPGCVGFKTLLDLKVTFTVEEKRVEPSLRLVSEWVACVRPMVALVTPDGLGIEGIELYGVEIRCELPGGITLRLATSVDPAKDSLVTGDYRFFELWQIYGPVVPCCGHPGRWQITTFFKRGSTNLLGLGLFDLVLYFPLSGEVLVNLGLKHGEVDPSDPTKTWLLTLGMKGVW